MFVLPWAAAPILVQLHHLDGATVAILFALSLGLPTLWITWCAYREPKRTADLSTIEVVDQLAIAVGAGCEAEARIRRFNDPYPLPVSWNAADPSLTDAWDSLVTLAGSAAGRPVPASDVAWAADLDRLAGEGGEIVDVLAKVPTGRLLVLGEPGTGKTMLMIRLVLDLLARRASGGPVPILAPVASWNPAEQDLRGWLRAQLLIDHPALAGPPPAGRPESDRAGALLASGLILPVLDGLDEIPEEVRGLAISRINDALGPGDRIVVTCRSQQYRDAVGPEDGRAVTLRGAAAVVLRPLDADDVRRYLSDDAAGPFAKARWEPVFEVLGTEAPAGQALSTPLMVGLARAIYNPRPGELAGILRDPAELRSPGLADRTAVESLLFDGFVPAAYRQDPAGPWKAKDAERWLVFLARHLEYTIRGPDLQWWQLGRSTPPRVTGLATGLIAGLTTGLAIEIALIIVTGVSAAFGGLWYAVPTVGIAAVTGLKWAPIGGLAAGLAGGIAAAVTVRHDQRPAPGARWSSRGRADPRAVGVIVGLMVGIAAWFWCQPWLAVGLGILAGILAMVAGQHAHHVRAGASPLEPGHGEPAGQDSGTSPDSAAVPVAGSAAVPVAGSAAVPVAGSAAVPVAGIVVGTMVGFTAGIVTGVLASSFADGLKWGITWGVIVGIAAAAGAMLKGAHGERPTQGARWNLRNGWPPAATAGAGAAVIGLLGSGSAFGLSLALIFGLTGGIAVGAIAGLEGVPDSLTTGASPSTVLARDRGTTILLALVTGISAGIAAGLVADVVAYNRLAAFAEAAFAFGLGIGISAGFTIGAGFGLAVSGFGSAWPRWLVARGWMALSGRLPRRLITFLDDAHQRGVLSQVGAVYQFRHIELQHRLATRDGDNARANSSSAAPAASDVPRRG